MKNKATPKDITRKRTLTFDQRENVAIQNTQVFNLGISKRRKKKIRMQFLTCLFNTQS